MGQHKLPAVANRLRRSRGFDCVWYSDVHYGQLLQKDWLLARNAWSLITRASRSKPKQQMTLSQQLQQLQAMRVARDAGKPIDAAAAAAAVMASTSQGQGMASCDYPNHRVSRIFIQQLPYKSVVSTFAYAAPATGPQSKYSLFPRNTPTADKGSDKGGNDKAAERGDKQ